MLIHFQNQKSAHQLMHPQMGLPRTTKIFWHPRRRTLWRHVGDSMVLQMEILNEAQNPEAFIPSLNIYLIRWAMSRWMLWALSGEGGRRREEDREDISDRSAAQSAFSRADFPPGHLPHNSLSPFPSPHSPLLPLLWATPLLHAHRLPGGWLVWMGRQWACREEVAQTEGLEKTLGTVIDQELASHNLPPLFVNKALLKQPHLFIDILSTSAFTLQWRNWVIVTETMSTKPKMLALWPFTEKVCGLLV